MSSAKLSLEPMDDVETWDALVRRSPQGTLFSESAYLQATGRRNHLWRVTQGAELKAGVCLVVSDDERSCQLDDLVIYGGILFDLDPARALVKRRHDEFQITEYVAEQLAGRYSSVALPLCPQFDDMRPFQWYRYHDDKARQYALTLRYTSYLAVATLADHIGREEQSPFFAAMETVRRYSIREAQRKGGLVFESLSALPLIGYYGDLMSRQGETQAAAKLQAMERVINVLLETGRGRIFHVTDADGTLLYAVMYGWDSKRGYYLFGAGHPQVSTPWQGSAVHWAAFKYLAQQQGIREIDLEGVNSPQRGWFKLGFGGDLRAYFQVCTPADLSLP